MVLQLKFPSQVTVGCVTLVDKVKQDKGEMAVIAMEWSQSDLTLSRKALTCFHSSCFFKHVGPCIHLPMMVTAATLALCIATSCSSLPFGLWRKFLLCAFLDPQRCSSCFLHVILPVTLFQLADLDVFLLSQALFLQITSRFHVN